MNVVTVASNTPGQVRTGRPISHSEPRRLRLKCARKCSRLITSYPACVLAELSLKSGLCEGVNIIMGQFGTFRPFLLLVSDQGFEGLEIFSPPSIK